MEINEKLYVKAEDFFEQLAESIAYDITTSTGKKVRPKAISKGYSYSKKMKNKMGKNGEVKVTITDFEAPKIYAAKFESVQGTNYLSYSIENFGDSIGVTYSEGFDGKTASKSLNYKLMSFFYNRKSRKKASKLMRAMEHFIKEKEAATNEDVAIEEKTEE